jgi:hypothetical protein
MTPWCKQELHDAREFVRDWRAGDCWLATGGRVGPGADHQRQTLRSVRYELLRRGGHALQRLFYIRFDDGWSGKESPAGHREQLAFVAGALIAVRVLLRRLPPQPRRSLFDGINDPEKRARLRS